MYTTSQMTKSLIGLKSKSYTQLLLLDNINIYQYGSILPIVA